MASIFAHLTRKGLRDHAYKFHQQRCCTSRREFAFTIRIIPFWNKLRFLGEIFQDTAGCPLPVPVPRSTHLTHLLSQPIPSAHIDPRKTRPLSDTPATSPGRL